MFLSVIKAACKLNIFEINFVFSSEKINLFKNLNPKQLPKKGVLIRFFVFWGKLFYYLYKLDFSKKSVVYKSDYLLFASTKNQSDMIDFISKKINDVIFLGQRNNGSIQVKLFYAYLIAIPFFPIVFYRYIKAQNYNKKSFSYCFDIYWCIYGLYILHRINLKKINPNVVIIANDHSYENTVLKKAAKDAGIKTVYIQHASVSLKFPPMDFDFALLDGFDALEKYSQCGIRNTKIFLCGISKFDNLIDKVNRNNKIQRVGVCFNDGDKQDVIEQMIGTLILEFPDIKFVIRPHPSDVRGNYFKEYAISKKLDFSNSKQEKVIEFLSNVDAIIAGESNIHLEAILLNVYPFYFRDQIKDNYAFIKNNVIESYATNLPDLINHINKIKNNKPYVRAKGKFYSSTIDTKYDNKSQDLIVNLLKQISAEKIDFSIWEENNTYSNFTAYQLKL